MLKKITEITRVGRFIGYTAAGVGQYGKLTLVFGENAKGKTTLTAILRSAQTGDARP
jgi:wobble nucleotide-excising tRNase